MSRLVTNTVSEAATSSVLLVNRNFMRNNIGNHNAIPARLQ